MKKLLFAGLAACAVSLPNIVLAKTYTFELEGYKGLGWIPEVSVISHDPAKDEVIVFDPVIKHFFGDPLVGRVSINNSRRITFTWELKDFTAKGEGWQQYQAGLIYRLTIQHSSLTATISMLPKGFDNRLSGSGQCKVEN